MTPVREVDMCSSTTKSDFEEAKEIQIVITFYLLSYRGDSRVSNMLRTEFVHFVHVYKHKKKRRERACPEFLREYSILY